MIPDVFKQSNMDRSGISEAKQKALAGLRLGLCTGSLPKCFEEAGQLGSVLDRRRLSIDPAKIASPSVAPALREAHAQAVDVVARVARRSVGSLTGVAPASASSKAAQLDRVLDGRRLSVDPAKLEAAGVAPELRQAHSAAVEAVAKVTRASLQIVAGGTVEDDMRILDCAREAAAAAVARAVTSCRQRPAAQTAASMENPALAEGLAVRRELARILGASMESGALKVAMDEVSSRGRSEEEEAAARAEAVAVAPSSTPLDKTRLELARALQDALEGGRLRSVMDQLAAELTAKDDMEVQQLQSPQEERPEQLQRQQALALAAFKRLSEQDRRLGELHGLIAVTKQRVAEKDESCKKMEDFIKQARGDIEHLELNIEWHKQAMQDSERRSEELEALQRKFALTPGNLRAHDATKEADDLKAHSVDSEHSTATGTTAGNAFPTVVGGCGPLSGLRTALEPIAPRC